MQHKFTVEKPLLDDHGHLQEKGYGTELLLQYDRSRIKANGLRIKEWDYYLITNDRYGVALTVADNSYMGLHSASFLDFQSRKEKTTSVMTALPLGKTNLPASSKSGDVIFANKRVQMSFLHRGNQRVLSCRMDKFDGDEAFAADFVLEEEPRDSMCIATPFKEDDKAFYYNQKINCLRASGSATYQGKDYVFDRADSFAVLDWGRGVWTYDNTWYWGSASGMIDGKTFGFNIGYGFGDTTAASENMLFYDGIAHKLEDVGFHIPTQKKKDMFMEPWKFTSSDDRFVMDFTPILDRHAFTSVFIIESNQHQVFGYFNGRAVLDDGTVLEVRDFLGFAEKVQNMW